MKSAITLLVVLLCPLAASAHGGEDHGEAERPAHAPGQGERTVYAQTERFELVLKYSSAPAGAAMPVLVLLTDWATNRPIEGATIQLDLSGPAAVTAQARPTRAAGVYRASASFPSEGHYALVARVTADGQSDLLVADDVSIGREDATGADTRASGPHPAAWPWIAGAAAAIALLAAAALVARRARGRRRPSTSELSEVPDAQES